MIILIDSSYFHIYNLGSLTKYYKLAEKDLDIFSDNFLEHYTKTWCDKIEKIYKIYDINQIYFCRDDYIDRLWRREIYDNYKKNRPNKETENSLFLRKFYQTNFKFLCFKYNIRYIRLSGLEGDDIIANLSNYYLNLNNKKDKDINKVIIIANDKDICQLVNKTDIRVVDMKNIFDKKIKYYEKLDILDLYINGDTSDNIKKISKDIKTKKDLEKFKDKEKLDLYYKLFNLEYSIKIFKKMFKFYLCNKYLINFNNTLYAKVVNRPSKVIKSPYLADIIIDNKDSKKEIEEMAHTPSLGMCGYIDKDATILIEKIPEGSKRKTKYNILAVKTKEPEIPSPGYVWIGANPLFANKLFKILLDNNLIPNISNIKYLDVKAEFKVGKKRLDYYIYDNFMKEKIFIEIKHLPIVDFNSDKKNKIKSDIIDYENNYKRCSIFPDGSTANKKEGCISIRAYEHLEELENMVKLGHRSILFMFSLRNDVYGFYPNYKRDVKYSKKFYECLDNGVEIQGHKFKFNKKGIKYDGQIPLIPKDKLPNF